MKGISAEILRTACLTALREVGPEHRLSISDIGGWIGYLDARPLRLVLDSLVTEGLARKEVIHRLYHRRTIGREGHWTGQYCLTSVYTIAS